MNDPIFEQYVSGVLKTQMLSEMAPPTEWTGGSIPDDDKLKRVATKGGVQGDPKLADYHDIYGRIRNDYGKTHPGTGNKRSGSPQKVLTMSKGFGTKEFEEAINRSKFFVTKATILKVKEFLEAQPNKTYPGSYEEFKSILTKIIIKVYANAFNGSDENPFFQVGETGANYIARLVCEYMEEKGLIKSDDKFANKSGPRGMKQGGEGKLDLLGLIDSIDDNELMKKIDTSDVTSSEPSDSTSTSKYMETEGEEEDPFK